MTRNLDPSGVFVNYLITFLKGVRRLFDGDRTREGR